MRTYTSIYIITLKHISQFSFKMKYIFFEITQKEKRTEKEREIENGTQTKTKNRNFQNQK